MTINVTRKIMEVLKHVVAVLYLLIRVKSLLTVHSDFTISVLLMNFLSVFYSQYFNQILTVVLEVVDDEDFSIREVALSLISEMLKSQVCYLLSLIDQNRL